eukprot:m.97938 g.97938  ORF g.97938 m.97938 type:complete len:218 (-) comp8997_c3_seq3:1292-1945(-)
MMMLLVLLFSVSVIGVVRGENVAFFVVDANAHLPSMIGPVEAALTSLFGKSVQPSVSEERSDIGLRVLAKQLTRSQAMRLFNTISSDALYIRIVDAFGRITIAKPDPSSARLLGTKIGYSFTPDLTASASTAQVASGYTVGQAFGAFIGCFSLVIFLAYITFIMVHPDARPSVKKLHTRRKTVVTPGSDLRNRGKITNDGFTPFETANPVFDKYVQS